MSLLSVVGCTAKGTGADVTPPVEVPAAYGAEPEGPTEPLVNWCSDFSDPQLDALEAMVIQDNLDLRVAWARLEQADAIARQSGALRYPQINVDTGVSRSQVYVPPPLLPEPRNNFVGSLGASYEIDLWGKIAETVEAAELDAMSVRLDLEALAMTLSASVAETWLDVVFQREARALLERQIETNETFLALLMLRLAQGLAAAPDVLLQRQATEGVRATLELITAAEETAQQRLAVLVGRPPNERLAGDRGTLPEAPPTPDPGLPADLLEQRPDVRAAGLRVRAADHRVAAAIADQLPSLRISASVGIQANAIAELLDVILWSIAGAITAPLLDGGRRSAEVDRTEAVLDERIFAYGQTLLTAMLEVESALVLESQQKSYIAGLEVQLATSDETVDAERRRYQRGISDYLRVITALQTNQRIERTLLDARRNLLTYRIQLCRAVGGDWTRALERPEPPESSDE